MAAVTVDWTPWDKFSNWFNLNGQQKSASAEEIARTFVINNKYGLNLNEARFLTAVFDFMPENLRLYKSDGTTTQTLVEFINILPIIGLALNAFQKNPADASLAKLQGSGPSVSTSPENLAKLASSVSSKIRSGYVNTQLEALAADPANQEKLLNLSEEEKIKLAEGIVNSSDQSPLATITLGVVPGGVETTGASPLEQKLQAEGYGVPMPTAGTAGDLTTWDEYLRANPNSSFTDLVNLEYQGEGFTDGFDMSGILDADGTFQIKDEKGNVKLWNAIDANNLIYDLYEKGDTEKIIYIQDMMRKAGYFGETIPIMGIVDATTVTAWQLFLTDAARSNRSPADQYKFNVTERQKIRATDIYRSGQDPIQVEQFVQQAGESVLGRGLTQDEVRSVTQAILQWEKQAVTSGFSANDPAQFNFEARVNDLIQRQNRDELRYKTMQSMGEYWGVQDWAKWV